MAVTKINHLSKDDRGAAISLTSAVVSSSGYVPSTPIFRSLRNSMCEVWEDDCLEEEVCWSYNRNKYRIALNSELRKRGCARDECAEIQNELHFSRCFVQ